jgi:hypothetical protein
MRPDNKPMNFSDVLHDELDLIAREKKETPPSREEGAESRAWRANLQALAFSGGGIRSATFCLGVLQKLVESRHVHRFDYLSTVSGGGYIGSWFSSLLQRRPWLSQVDGKEGVSDGNWHLSPLHFFKTLTPQTKFAEANLPPATLQLEDAWNNAKAKGCEPESVSWLRRYSNYLTPQMGLSGDSVAAIAFWMRNTLLNQVLLGLFFFLVLLFPQWLFLSLIQPAFLPTNTQVTGNLLGVGLISIVASMFMCALELPKTKPDIRRVMPWYVVTLAVMCGYGLSLGLYHYRLTPPEFMSHLLGVTTAGMGFWTVCIALLYALPWWCATVLNESLRKLYNNNPCEPRQSIWFSGIAELIVPIISGLVGGVMIYLLADFIGKLPDTGRDWWAAGFGTALMLVIFCLTLIVHQGLMARLFRISQFEWWARLGGVVLLIAACWAGAHALLVYSPPFFDVMEVKYAAAGGITWLVPTLTGLWFAKGGDTSGKGGVRWKEWVVAIAPYLLVFGLLAMLSVATHRLVFQENHTHSSKELCQSSGKTRIAPLQMVSHAGVATTPVCDVTFQLHLEQTLQEKNQTPTVKLFYILLIFGFVFVVLAWRLDVNLFSIHYFYRNRLTRCYLGASRYIGNQRDAHPFTGFDSCDDLKLHKLTQRPLHLLNTAINLSHRNELAWQDRKASSFTFSPIACGYSYRYGKSSRGGYCDSKAYMGGVYLGTAMAASGAAASPNMGYHTSPVTAFMLTVFNVRLGHWCPNPVYRHLSVIKQRSPTLGAWYLFKELFAQSGDEDQFVYLSDGGHFENLGVYELVRRRCRMIMVVDGSEDEARVFEDFANMTRKCYTDFGVKIDIDLKDLRINKDTGLSPRCWALGDIVYPNVGENAAVGVLLYVKPSMMANMPEDILNYAAKNVSFPHQPTPDQFFDEAQFESYRKLGYTLMGKVLGDIAQTSTPSGQKWTGFDNA